MRRQRPVILLSPAVSSRDEGGSGLVSLGCVLSTLRGGFLGAKRRTKPPSSTFTRAWVSAFLAQITGPVGSGTRATRKLVTHRIDGCPPEDPPPHMPVRPLERRKRRQERRIGHAATAVNSSAKRSAVVWRTAWSM